MVKIDRDELLQAISHLSEEEKLILRKDYFSGMKIKAIKDKYKISSFRFSLRKCHYVFPLIGVDEECPNCKEKLFHLERSREDLKDTSYIILFCDSCGHQETLECNCDYCKLIRKEKVKEEIEKKRVFIRERINFENYVPISLDDLSFRDKVLLGTLIQSGIEDDFLTLKPLSSSSMPIFPSDNILHLIVKELQRKHILEISPNSKLEYFTPDYDNDTFRYYWKEVSYLINVKEFLDNQSISREFLNPHSWMLQYSKNDPAIWEEIVFWESLSLFNYILDFYHIRYDVGKETEDFFWTVTKQLPLTTVYSIIYQSGKNVAAYSKTDRCPKYVAYNSILQNMRTSRDKILSGQYQRWEYNRPEKECPQSIVSQYYFNTILKICDSYWKMLPSDYFRE